jgi:hypothetical protein
MCIKRRVNDDISPFLAMSMVIILSYSFLNQIRTGSLLMLSATAHAIIFIRTTALLHDSFRILVYANNYHLVSLRWFEGSFYFQQPLCEAKVALRHCVIASIRITSTILSSKSTIYPQKYIFWRIY